MTMSRSVFYTFIQHENFKFWNYFQLNFSCLLIRKSNHLNGNKKKFSTKSVLCVNLRVLYIFKKNCVCSLINCQVHCPLNIWQAMNNPYEKKHTHNSDKPITPLNWSIACLSLYRSMHKTLCKMNWFRFVEEARKSPKFKCNDNVRCECTVSQ